ncbi:MAG TPA: glycosyltransferase family 4 protein [Desulfatiglandales bacterium]|nr:glycosyltransferase family 4 protein [Desulfatiglandales bacterium]
MRILLSTGIFELAGGGAENFAFRLSRALADRGHDMHVVTDRGGPVPGISVYQGIAQIDKFIEELRPDLTVDWGFNHPADLHRLGGGAHQHFLEHSLNAYHGLLRWYKRLRNRSPKHRAVIRKQAEMLRRPGAFFLANSRFAADQVIAAGARPEAVGVLHNGVDTGMFRPAKGKEAAGRLRKKWGLGPSEVAVLFIAHNLLLKNFALLRDIFQGLASRYPGMKLIVVGKRKPSLMPPNSVYAGELSDMVTCYQAADFLAHPTFFDSCANVVLEAMSAGLPVATSNVCGAHELVEEGKSGFVLPVTGKKREIRDKWMKTLQVMGTDEVLRRRMGAAGREAMLGNDFGYYVTRLEGFMKQVLERKKGHDQ